MKILKNQIIAKEGVLTSEGKRYLKRWAELQRLIGKSGPITKEHPEGNKVRPETKTYGTYQVKQCPLGNNLLCADLELEDDAPECLGYSIGFPFKELDESGIFHAEPFDAIQDIQDMDHLALTDFPRDPNALNDDFVESHYNTPLHDYNFPLQTSGDSAGDVNISVMGIDSYKFDLNARSAFKSISKSDLLMGELEDLKKQLTELQKMGADAVPKSEYERIKAENEAFKKDTIEKEKAIIQNAIDSLKKDWDFSDKDMEGHDASELKGAKWALDLVAKTIPTSNATATLLKNEGDAAMHLLSKMVYKDGQLQFRK